MPTVAMAFRAGFPRRGASSLGANRAGAIIGVLAALLLCVVLAVGGLIWRRSHKPG